MNMRMPSKEMMRAVEKQRKLDPNFDPTAEIERLGAAGFGSLFALMRCVHVARNNNKGLRCWALGGS